MKRVKNDKYYAMEIMEDIQFVIYHTKDIDIEELSDNKILLDSVMFRFIQISEKYQMNLKIKTNISHGLQF